MDPLDRSSESTASHAYTAAPRAYGGAGNRRNICRRNLAYWLNAARWLNAAWGPNKGNGTMTTDEPTYYF